MQVFPAQMANRDGDAGMETMLWDINIIPNELDNGYLMLPPGVLHMSALGRFRRFTLFSPRVSHSKHLPVFCFVLCFGFGGVCCFVVFLFPVLQVFGIPNSPRSLDLDDRQGFIASSAMQQKKKREGSTIDPESPRTSYCSISGMSTSANLGVDELWKYMDAPIYTKVHEIDFALFVHCMVFWWYFHFG